MADYEMGYIQYDDIIDTSPLSLKKLNDQLRSIRNKVMGGISGLDIQANSITADNIDVTTLHVGAGGIRLDPSATISWSQITDAPMIDHIDISLLVTDTELADTLTSYITTYGLQSTLSSYVTNATLTNNYVTNSVLASHLANYITDGYLRTQIGYNFLVTGMVYANQIVGGDILGCTIRTSSVGSTYSQLREQYLSIFSNTTQEIRMGFDNYAGNLTPYIAFSNNTANIIHYLNNLSISNFVGTSSFNGVNGVNIRASGGDISLEASGAIRANGYPVLTTLSAVVARFS